MSGDDSAQPQRARTRVTHNKAKITTYSVADLPGWTVEEPLHFTQRQRERGVRSHEIRATLEHCDSSYPARGPHEYRYIKKIDHRNWIHIIGIRIERRKVFILKTEMVLPTGKMMRDEDQGKGR